MTTLLTGTGSPLGRALAAGLGAGPLRRCDDVPLDDEVELAALVDAIDVVIHVLAPATGDDAAAAIDRAARGTYQLGLAAAAAGARRMLLLSTLALVAAHDPSWLVDEDFRPRPADEPAALACHLAELVARELARARRLEVVVVRLGELVDALPPDGAPGSAALAVDDLVAAVEGALTLPPGPPYRLYHVTSPVPTPRFSIARARADLLGARR